jgi:propanol-preferring alcohol dehydrogenase
MKVQLLKRLALVSPKSAPLQLVDYPEPSPTDDEVLIRVHVCGVCHTELDEIEGRTAPPSLPIIPGHQVIGSVVAKGANVRNLAIGTRVGVAWIFSTCGRCSYCLEGRENLCKDFQATGRDRHGGYAELMAARADFVFPIPDRLTDTDAAPLLCAGAIGFRSLSLTGISDGKALGLTGFGASAHLVLKMVRHQYPKTPVFVFARSEQERAFASELGATWVGDTKDHAPRTLDAIIDTTPAWIPVVSALESLAPGGRLVINAIRKEAGDQAELLKLDYSKHLWMEREIKSVANVTRNDVQSFLSIASEASLRPQTRVFPLEDANQALIELKMGGAVGAKVLVIVQA